MRVGVIGCGSIGSRHARNLSDLGHALTVWDVRSPSEALVTPKSPGICFAASLSVLVEQQPSAMLICTPAGTHAAVARELLKEGYRGPLFVEKPIARTVEECEVFESWPHPTCMVGYNWRWNQDVRAWQERWALLPAHLTFQCDTNIRTWPGAEYAGPILECSHELDLVVNMLGPTFEISKRKKTGPSGVQLIGQTKATSVLIDLCWAAKRPHRMFLARFGDAVIRCLPSQLSMDQSYRDELSHFLACAEQNKRPDCTVADGVRVLDLLTVKVDA